MTSADEATWLTTPEVTEQAGISVRQASYWTDLGFLRPEGDGGSGKPWRWPEAEAEIARRMGRLTAAGLPLEWAAQFARSDWPSGPLAPGITITVTEEPSDA